MWKFEVIIYNWWQNEMKQRSWRQQTWFKQWYRQHDSLSVSVERMTGI